MKEEKVSSRTSPQLSAAATAFAISGDGGGEVIVNRRIAKKRKKEKEQRNTKNTAAPPPPPSPFRPLITSHQNQLPCKNGGEKAKIPGKTVTQIREREREREREFSEDDRKGKRRRRRSDHSLPIFCGPLRLPAIFLSHLCISKCFKLMFKRMNAASDDPSSICFLIFSSLHPILRIHTLLTYKQSH